uniref:Major Facilitator Superfamily (MFS) putative n=1 Tax=Albugo laibachii Nc14 TaxID=890382 RepID=F0W1S9_9STRA|nr:Major Facilitator Superfamily (MFS) putative [Albugo laibachii Nc14]CCA25499.1 Major Facilitator Superfamily (MFS) putative [Albugo laibachii Nc14]|eukprot:CCA25499.1 Major Facilitator Superfamily (MFS) putative [Albugo laibachii Nc14]
MRRVNVCLSRTIALPVFHASKTLYFAFLSRNFKGQTTSMNWFKKAGHNVRLAYIFTFFYWAANSILFQQILAGYVFQLTQSNKPVGIVNGIKGILQLVFSLPAGIASDRVRRDLILKFSGIIGICTSILTWYALLHSSLILLYGAFASWGVFTAFQNPSMEALFADSIPHGKRSFPFMVKYVICNVALICGPLACIVLFIKFGNSWKIEELTPVLCFGVVLAFIGSLLLFRFNDSLTLEDEFGIQTPTKTKKTKLETIPCNSPPLKTPTFENGFRVEYNYSDDEAEEEENFKDSSCPLIQTSEHENAINENTILLTKNCTNILVHPHEEDKFLCLRYKHVPIIIFISDFIISNGAGMTISFFPLFFKQEYGLSPIQVSWIFIAQPVLVIFLSFQSQRVSKRIGRMPIIILTRIISVICLICMTFVKPLALQIVFFLLRGGLMRCSQPLRRSLLMDAVPKKLRARWNALESLSVFSWSGSAFVGGYLIDTYDYRMCFLITSFVYAAGVTLELVLLPLTKHARER